MLNAECSVLRAEIQILPATEPFGLSLSRNLTYRLDIIFRTVEKAR